MLRPKTNNMLSIIKNIKIMSISCEICGEYNHFTRNCKHGPFNWKNIFGVSNFKVDTSRTTKQIFRQSSLVMTNILTFLKYNRLNKFFFGINKKISVFFILYL
ncbi:hypothetical protein BNATCHR297 (nucleomorph) [Bigelowiella natans]|uniref:Uncharacterized protein n=1 Tax=Bigelowiella natans TaxID=227086 RepID=Q3LW72_BIGNA|nr:hypothetical protein BNATCHR297 [Bigelowiella natans]ABA27294.1 hypothetical protein [Bigelowiella natans]